MYSIHIYGSAAGSAFLYFLSLIRYSFFTIQFSFTRINFSFFMIEWIYKLQKFCIASSISKIYILKTGTPHSRYFSDELGVPKF